MLKTMICSVLILLVVPSTQVNGQDSGQDNAGPKAPAKKRVNPAYQPPQIDARLPNVLLIGDSISIGYTIAVREELAGKANVFRPATNCGPSTRGLESIEQWIGDRKWDVIHFNFGLHDLKYLGPNGKNLADPAKESSFQQVPLEDYAKNLRQLAKRLKATGAKVIWRETTPVPKGAAGRVPGDSKIYNAAAAKVMSELGEIEIDPFYSFSESIGDQQRPANVHYTAKGSQQLGTHVANVILEALN